MLFLSNFGKRKFLTFVRCLHVVCIWTFFLGVISLSIIGLILASRPNALEACYKEQAERLPYVGNDTRVRLDDVLEASVQPKPGHSIFFIDSSCRQSSYQGQQLSGNTVRLTAQQACAIESAALHNPNFDIFLLFAAPKYVGGHQESRVLLKAILSYTNVHLRSLNIWTYADGTAVYDCLDHHGLFHLRSLSFHISIFLRYLTLFRFGGTYLGLNTITLRSLESLGSNYCGAEDDHQLNADVMNFASDGIGHHMANLCLLTVCKKFGIANWTSDAHRIITHIAEMVCDASKTKEMLMNRTQCLGLLVLPREAFYAVPQANWSHLFENHYLKETLAATSSSYLVHAWSNLPFKARLKSGAYGELAKQNCPKVYAASYD